MPSICAPLPPRMAGVTNDPAVNENTSVQPTASPGRLSGTVIRRKIRQDVAPNVRAASSIRGSMRPSEEASGSTIIGKKTCSEPITTAASEKSNDKGSLRRGKSEILPHMHLEQHVERGFDRGAADFAVTLRNMRIAEREQRSRHLDGIIHR